jgi:hypothetical protein
MGSNPIRGATYAHHLASSKAAMRLAVNQEIVGSNPTSPATHVALAQSVRAPGCELGGCGFEPRTSPQILHAEMAQQAEQLRRKQHEAV